MSKRNFTLLLLCLLIFSQIAASDTVAQASSPRYYRERFVIRALKTILGAQATYSATSGNGSYGSNLDLLEAGLIDAALADGNKYGYYFMFFYSRRTPTAPSKFYVTATPRQYIKTGKMSFYTDESGELRGADKNGGTATATDPIIDSCAEYEYEKCTIAALRSIHSAQMTYQTTTGNGGFGTLNQLYKAGLIGKSTGSGFNHGYRFTVTITSETSTTPASIKLSAIPDRYGANTVRSFYIGRDGVIRGTDKNGKPADENDPPVNY